MIVVGKAVIQAVPARRKSRAKVFVAVIQQGPENEAKRYEYDSRESAERKVQKFFASLGFVMRTGRPFDPKQANEDAGYEVFTQWKARNGEILEFQCSYGEGPTGFSKVE